MPDDPYVKLAGHKPMVLARRLGLSAGARSFLMPHQTVAGYVSDLTRASLFTEATAVLAHALPKREAVWWACMAVHHAQAPQPDSSAGAALAAAQRWVYQPTEENRRPIKSCAQRAGLDTAAGWAAISAFWSGGPMAPETGSKTEPDEALTGRAVAGAVALAALKPDPDAAPGHFRHFIAMAFDIARGGDGRHLSAA